MLYKYRIFCIPYNLVPLLVLVLDLNALEFRNVLKNRVVGKNKSSFNKLNSRNAGGNLRAGIKVIGCILSYGGMELYVLESALITENFLMILINYGIRAGHSQSRNEIIQKIL